MDTEVLVPNSQPDSQGSKISSTTEEVKTNDDKSFSTAVDSIATPPSSQSPTSKATAKQEQAPTTQQARISPSRPFTPSLEVPQQNRTGGSARSSPSSRSSGSPTHGTKRTASGLIKSTNEAALASPASNMNGVRRESISSSARIGELSRQLKTRLTYAMVKVENGWEKHNLDEVESIVSQMSSPASSVNGTYRTRWQSPRDAMANKNRRSRDFSLPLSAQANMASLTSSSPAAVPAGAWTGGYEQRPGLGYGVRLPSGPRLAPAPELTAAPRSRLAEERGSQSSGSSGQAAQVVYAPRPVSQIKSQTIRASTPTQQEQDAVDTLLFMSSPANSVHFANSQATSPRRGEFAVPRQPQRSGYGAHQPKRPSLVGRRSMSSEEDIYAEKRAADELNAERQAKRQSFGRLQSGKDVDRLLDQLADAAGSDEDDNTSDIRRTPRQATTMRM